MRDLNQIEINSINFLDKVNSIYTRMLKSQAFINEDKCEFLPNSETTIKTISSMLAISHKESKSKIKVALSDKFNFVVCENCLDQTHPMQWMQKIKNQ